MWDLVNTHHAEGEQNRTKADIHEFSNPIDDLVKPLAELIAHHKGHCQDKADSSGKNRITGKDDTHADLRLVACRVDGRVRSQMDHVLLVEDLLQDESICHDDEQASCCY